MKKIRKEKSLIIQKMRKKLHKKILSFIDCLEFRPLRILVNAGNGSAGPTFDLIEEGLKK